MQTVISGFARAAHLAVLSLVLGAASVGSAWGQEAADPAAVAEMLRDGGYVLVMRHTRAPQPSANQAQGQRGFGGNRGGRGGGRGGPAGAPGERQLDEIGQAHATALGFAFRQLGIEMGEVLRSPTLRAEQTATYLGYDASAVDELAPGAESADWLRGKAAEPPAAGTNRLLITHRPNIEAAFGEAAADMMDGETLVLRPEDDGARVVGRLSVRDWAVLAVGEGS